MNDRFKIESIPISGRNLEYELNEIVQRGWRVASMCLAEGGRYYLVVLERAKR